MSRESAIRQTHAAVTLEALEALANKGLLRRAQKDLERGDIEPPVMTVSGLEMVISGQRVTLVEAGPAKATCTCPAPGICQHILTACLKLKDEPATAPVGDALADWLGLSDDDLIAAYGLPVLRAGYGLSLANEVQIEHATILTVRFPTLNAEVVALPGAGLAGIIVNGLNAKKHSQLAAAALLAVRRANGKTWQPPVTETTRAAPMHREDVLNAISTLLEEAVTAGLARLSPALVERLDALALSAQTAELHRLGLLLQRIATQASDWLQRRAHVDLGQIFAEMATAYALTQAAPHIAAGVARESYLDVGNLDLVGVAAWPWRTPSGYEGLTLLFWDAANAAWNTWSDARPLAFAAGFSAQSRFGQPGPWEGAESPAQLVRSRFRLMQAKRNRWGRLSSSAQSKILVTSGTELSSLPSCSDWSALNLTSSVGLRESDPRRAYQLLAPASWERCPFDPITQSLTWILSDAKGNKALMRLAFDEFSKKAIEHLEAMPAEASTEARLVGRCSQRHGLLVIQPLAIVREGHATLLYFEEKGVKLSVSAAIVASADSDVDEAESEDLSPLHSKVGEIALAIISAIEWLAETGARTSSVTALERLEQLAKEVASGARLSKLLSATAAASAESRPKLLLRLRWMMAVLQQSVS